ncbi:hypothetical protein T01_4074 [Trichinella spiralis]|uniref:Uncharacterized protein n=1 Tax=Trichinella spiralis TaxID=6334 RepID=A0A0V1BTC2_TRISP|nr:hypothetical protein T01_4074 [Trichinella spiralis]
MLIKTSTTSGVPCSCPISDLVLARGSSEGSASTCRQFPPPRRRRPTLCTTLRVLPIAASTDP